ncbi:MAG: S8 family serine peptidase [Candidatus Hodarchaeota archaeon]
MTFHPRVSLLLLLLIIQSLVLSSKVTQSLVDPVPNLSTAKEGLRSSWENWASKNPLERTQAIFLFKKDIPQDLPGVQVLHRFKLQPALLLEGSVKQLGYIAHQERSNLVTFSENQRSSSMLPVIPHQMSDSALLAPTAELIREIIGAASLHELGYNGLGIRIGIIDTGVNADHPDFEGRVVAERSFVMRELGYSTDVVNATDEDGHGTWVAGVAAGKKYGIAPKAEIISAKIFGNASVTGNGGKPEEETTAAMIAAIEYCVQKGADIINLSLGQYHNLPWDLRQHWINQVSLNYGVIFTIAAGNSGYSGIDGGTVNNPGTALQAITVSAAVNLQEFAGFSATGPKPDYSMKPDLSAPGVGIWGPNKNGDYTRKSGTSASTPLVAGAAALLLQYTKEEKISATPGTIKAALMSGAVSMQAEGTSFPAWQQGAGFLRASKAFNILKNSKTENSFDLFYIHPRKLPFKPFSTLFKGQEWTFNLTVIASGQANVTIDVPSSGLQINAPIALEIHDSQLIPISFFTPDTASEGPISVTINITSEEGVNSDFKIEGTVKQAIFSILLDEAHQIIAKRPERTSRPQHYGDNNNIYGAFRDWTNLMESLQIAVTPYVGPDLNSSILEKYDLFVMLNPFSYNYDIFTDWITPENRSYVSFTRNEIQALQEWIDTRGALLVITRGNSTIYLPALNEFLSSYGIALNFDDIGPFWSYEIRDPITERGTYAGPTLLSSNPQNSVFATIAPSQHLVVGHQRASGSRVLVLGTDYCFDNYAFNGLYGLEGSQNKQFVLDLMGWVLQLDFPKELLFSSSSTAENSSETFSNTGFLIFPLLMMIIAVSLRRWHKRAK